MINIQLQVNKYLHYIFVSALLALGIGSGVIAVSAKEDWDEAAHKRKADYLFLQSQCLDKNDGNLDNYYLLLKRAFSEDTTNIDVGAELGYYEVMMASDADMRARGLARVKRHFDEEPQDLVWSKIYANIVRQTYDIDEVLRVESILDSIYPDKTDISLQYSQDLIARHIQGDSTALPKSMAILNRIEEGVGKEPWLVSRKIRAYSAIGDTTSILREVQEMLDASPSNVSNMVFAAETYGYFQFDDKALELLNKACEMDSTNGNAFYSRAELYKSMGDSVAYDSEVFHALKMNTLDVDTKLQLLTDYVRELYTDTVPAQQKRIVDLFNILIEQHPHESQIHTLYGTYLNVMNKYSEAAEQFQYAVDIDPSDSDKWAMLLSLYWADKNYAAIEKNAERAIELFPERSMWYTLTALCYSEQGEKDKAIALLQNGLAVPSLSNEDRSTLFTSIGDVYHQINDTDSAYVYYDKALVENPSNVLTLNNYAYFLSLDGTNLDRAERMSAMAVKAEPDNATYLDTYAWVFFKKQEYGLAKQYIDSALLKSSEDEISSDLYEHAGDIYFMNGSPDEALDYWKRALELDPENELLQRKVKHKTYFYK
jgi:tetratricopeptide (TPR) repeat protein